MGYLGWIGFGASVVAWVGDNLAPSPAWLTLSDASLGFCAASALAIIIDASR